MAKYQKKFFDLSSITQDQFGNTKITVDIKTLEELIRQAKPTYKAVSFFIGVSQHTGKPYLYYLEKNEDGQSTKPKSSDELLF